jgi:SHS2 domain-containing protein
MTPNWEHFPHEADMGVRGIGPTREAAFEGAALALSAVITDPTEVIPVQKVGITCHAPDDELLLVDWLNASSMKWQHERCCLAVSKFTSTTIRYTPRPGGNRLRSPGIDPPSK